MAKYLKEFSTTAEYNTYINGTPDLPNVSLTLDNNEVHYNKYIDYSKEYLTFEALANGTFSFYSPAAIDSTKMTSVSYSIDDGANWVTTMIDNTDQTITTPTINAGDKVLWKGVGTALNKSGQNLPIFRSTANCNVSGNIMSMLYGDNFIGQTTLTANYAFYELFRTFYDYRAKIVSAGNLILPATTLTTHCYEMMFNGCTTLTTAPKKLPATTSVRSCYYSMFNGCTSLTTAPELPATTLTDYCYQEMFRNCTSLTTAPELPALHIGNYSYGSMFKGCTRLNYVKAMFTTDITTNSRYYCQFWLDGVAATGTFVKNAAATWELSGADGIPSGWTVETATA